MNDRIQSTPHGHVLEIALNRPEAFNAFDLDTIVALNRHLTMASMDDAVRAIVLTGKGKAFCSGGDLKWVTGFADSAGKSFHTLAAQFHLVITEIRRMSKPIIAAINGVAAGGGFSLALACDFRVMETSAVLRQGYTSNGLCIDGGGTFTLPRLVGLARALEIAAFDPHISSDRALEWGLVTRVVEDGAALNEALAMAEVLAQKSLHSFGWSKKLLTDAFNHSLESHLEMEREGLTACGIHADGREGIAAFVEKRKPVFAGS